MSDRIKQLVILSGKGGTGKTIIAASFASLAKNKVMADCDVDAADLHLLLNPTIKEKHPFKSGETAKIDKKLCQECGKCIVSCRFDAISDDFIVDPISCEGCTICSLICPENAIDMKENISGEWFISNTKYGPFVHAKLGIAEENSGKLITTVRQKANQIAEKGDYDLIIIDGSPGIGCPVIASLAGADAVLVVAEPTLSGIHDMERVIGLAHHFGIEVFVVINKYDLNHEMSNRIESFCADNRITLTGKILYDPLITKALVNRQNIVEYSKGEVANQMRDIWEKVFKELES